MNEYTINYKKKELVLNYNGYDYMFDLEEEEKEFWSSFMDPRGITREILLDDKGLTVYPLVRVKEKIGLHFSYSLQTNFEDGELILKKTIIPA